LKKINCAICPNNSCLIKKNFVQEWSNVLESEKYQAIYKRDHSIFSVGNPILGLFFVQSGMVKEFILRPQNNVEIVRFVDAGQVFGHAGFGNNYYSFGADAKIDSVVCFFNNEALQEMYVSNPKLLYDLMLFYSNEHSESTYRLMCISQMNLREKVASVLYYLYKNFGLNEENELLEYFTRDDIANLACTNSEQVSRQLSDFQKEGIIEKRARRIAILRTDELKDIIQDYLITNNSTPA
jgi:CRP/FNR family transcriptional regulator, anaerobic regulatory protein